MNRLARLSIVVLLLLTVAGPAAAYIGPGGGVTVIGAALAMLATIGAIVFSLVWYPIRKLRRRKRQAAEHQERNAVAETEDPPKNRP